MRRLFKSKSSSGSASAKEVRGEPNAHESEVNSEVVSIKVAVLGDSQVGKTSEEDFDEEKQASNSDINKTAEDRTSEEL